MRRQVKSVLSRQILLVALVAAVSGLFAISLLAQDQKDAPLKSHLTIYVGEPLLSNGGTVIIGSIPVSVTVWNELDGFNLATDDPNNKKRSELRPEDKLLGAFVYGPVSYVEMFYPEGGTFSFNFVPDVRIANPSRIVTERILVGSGGWFDRQNEIERDWPDVSTIYVAGPLASKGNSRLARIHGNKILNLSPETHNYEGAVVYTPTDEQLNAGTFGEFN